VSLKNDLYQVWTLGGLPLKTLGKRVISEIREDDVFGFAARLAYYFLFSLFPFFIFLAAVLAYVPIPDLMQQIMTMVNQLVPGAAAEMMQDTVLELVTQPRGGLLSFGIVLALWTASSAVVGIAVSLNRAYGVKESRPFWKVRGMAILITIGIAVLIILSMALLIFGPQLGHWLANSIDAGAAFDIVWSIARWPVVVMLMTVAVALIYYFVPDVEQEWRWVTPGSVLAVLIWIAVSLLFGLYVENFANYDKTYGSIGAVIVLMMWMYFSAASLLIGGEVNAEIEHAAASGKDEGEKKLPPESPKKKKK
jgi:membrane protein